MARRLTPTEVHELLNQLDPAERNELSSTQYACTKLNDILRKSYTLTTDDELQSFTALAARQVYVHHALRVPKQLAQKLERTRTWIVRTLCTGTEYPRDQLRPAFETVRAWLMWHANPDHITSIADFPESPHDPSRAVWRLVVTNQATIHDSKGNVLPVLVCTDQQHTHDLRVHLHGRWRSLAHMVWPGAVIHAIGASSQHDNTIACTDNSLLVLEPDLLLDVTTVAECFTGSHNTHVLALWRLLATEKPSTAALIGTVVNTCFDELLADPSADPSEGIERALRARYLEVLAAVNSGQISLNDIASRVGEHVETIQRVIPNFKGRATTEPSFIAPLYGIQGRLDVLLEDESDPRLCSIVELKSGNAPPLQHLAASNGKRYSIGMRPNHAMQIAGYNLLLDAAIPGREGTSSIFYSSDRTDPLRNAPNVHDFKADFIVMRNSIVSMFWALAHRRFRAFDRLATLPEEHMPALMREEILAWQHTINHLSQQESFYIRAYIAFAFREWIAQLIGNSWRGGGFASLWQMSIPEKTEQMSSLTWLVLDPHTSDFHNGYMTFTWTDNTPPISPFRVGDIAVLYPHSAIEEDGTIRGQVLKCSVRTLTDRSVTVSLRNKLFDRRMLEQHQYWALDGDVLSVGTESMIRACADFARLPADRRQLLLGKIEPRYRPTTVPRPPNMTDTQYELLCRALSADDYFLLEGPPGTGKTRTMIRSIVASLLQDDSETILCTALTNRAVDEICSALAEHAAEGLVLRMGTLESTEHTHIAFAAAARKESFDELLQRLDRARIVVATVPFLNANGVLFNLKTFTTAIVDEASQLLEPHLIGVVSRVNRFILIGDACQLPAVVQQDERMCVVSHELFDDIMLQRLDSSLFERLLRLAKRNGWEWAHGRLTEQARMHRLIAEYPGTMFYGVEFGTVNQWQQSDDNVLELNAAPDFLRYRLVFIETPQEPNSGYNRIEAEIAATCATSLIRSRKSQFTVGIVTPFRKQIRTIVSYLGVASEHVTVDTVERFQGSERDHIIISCAVNTAGDMRLVESVTVFDGRTIDRKLNVALTRARQQVIVLGCAAILRSSPAYGNLIRHIADRGIILRWEDAHSQLGLSSLQALMYANSRD
ncbi:MAG: AAA domain-containing protein [Chlorobi bacterium]|nr:AAA domain-containing protein [Chlorobiota bacterium]